MNKFNKNNSSVTSIWREFSSKTIPHHECTEEEYAEFYPIVSSDEGYLQLAKYAGGLYCIDWDIEEPHLIFGEHANYVS